MTLSNYIIQTRKSYMYLDLGGNSFDGFKFDCKLKASLSDFNN